MRQKVFFKVCTYTHTYFLAFYLYSSKAIFWGTIYKLFLVINYIRKEDLLCGSGNRIHNPHCFKLLLCLQKFLKLCRSTMWKMSKLLWLCHTRTLLSWATETPVHLPKQRPQGLLPSHLTAQTQVKARAISMFLEVFCSIFPQLLAPRPGPGARHGLPTGTEPLPSRGSPVHSILGHGAAPLQGT